MKRSLFDAPSKAGAVCVICGDPVALESSKTDEHGRAVHEDCYVNITIALLAAQQEAVRLSCLSADRLLRLQPISAGMYPLALDGLHFAAKME